MSYIIRISVGQDYRYFIRKGCNDVITLGTKPRGAARFNTEEEARRAATVGLGGLSYDIITIE